MELTGLDALEFVRGAGIPVCESRAARDGAGALAAARELGYPVALKALGVSHKSDVGGVKLGLRSEEEVRRAWTELQGTPGARGALVQRMAPPGLELIIGASRDPQFGPVLLFGVGGVLVELYRDVALRLIPVTEGEAREMVAGIRGAPLLAGYRGRPAVDTGRVVETLLKVSRLVHEHPEVREMDINPLMAHSGGALAVDARVVRE